MLFIYYRYFTIIHLFIIDILKCFVKLNPTKVIEDLHKFNIPGNLATLLENFLSNGLNFVQYAGCTSDPFIPSSGVPQGWNLGPTLFTALFNGVRDTRAKKLLYADDTKFLHKVKSIRDCLTLLGELLEFIEWCAEIGLRMNVDKCKIITFHRSKKPIQFEYQVNGVKIERVYSICDLGLNFNYNFASENVQK